MECPHVDADVRTWTKKCIINPFIIGVKNLIQKSLAKDKYISNPASRKAKILENWF